MMFSYSGEYLDSASYCLFPDQFTARIPKSPVRELLELEPETAKFE